MSSQIDGPGPVEDEGEKESPTPRWGVFVEDALIILGILPLWPVILGWRGVFWQGLLVGDLAVLLVIFARRWKRAKAALESIKQEEQKGPRLPFVPPGRRL